MPSSWRTCRRMLGYCLTGVTTEHASVLLLRHWCQRQGHAAQYRCRHHGRLSPHCTDRDVHGEQQRAPSDRSRRARRRATCHRQRDREGPAVGRVSHQAVDRWRLVSARFMRQDFFDYMPQFKLIVSGNHKPTLSTVDEAMRRRFNLLPFVVTIPPEKSRPRPCREAEDRNGPASCNG